MLPFHANNAGVRIFPDVKFDVVVARYLNSAAYLKAWRFGSLFVDVDDDPVEVVETYGTFPWCFNAIYARVVQWWRDRILSHAQGGWCARKTSTLRLDVLENKAFGPSVEYEPEAKRENLLLIVGKLDYVPNQKGIDQFLKTVWPFLHKADVDLRLVLIGKGEPPRNSDWWTACPNVTLVGYVADLLPWYERAFATIAPEMVGGGTSIKVVESLHYGRPCLASVFARRVCTDKGIHEGVFPLEGITAENVNMVLMKLRSMSPVSLMKTAARMFGSVPFEDVVERTIGTWIPPLKTEPLDLHVTKEERT